MANTNYGDEYTNGERTGSKYATNERRRMNRSSHFTLVFIETARGWKGRGALKIRTFYLATAHPLSHFWRYNRHRGWTPESPRGIWLAAEDYRSVQAFLHARAEAVSFRDQPRPRPA